MIEQKKNRSERDIITVVHQKTVEELNHRLQKINLNTRATNFHKLGYNLIKTYYETVPVVTNENTLSSVVTTYLQEDLFNDTNALQAYIQYVACYMNIPEDYDHYGSLGEKTDTEKGIDLVTLREKCEPLNMVANAIHDTLKGEQVKPVLFPLIVRAGISAVLALVTALLEIVVTLLFYDAVISPVNAAL